MENKNHVKSKINKKQKKLYLKQTDRAKFCAATYKSQFHDSKNRVALGELSRVTLNQKSLKSQFGKCGDSRFEKGHL